VHVKILVLANDLGISQPTTSRHLKLLRERGLVSATRVGASVEYRLTADRLIHMKLPGMSGTVEQHMITDVGEASLVEK